MRKVLSLSLLVIGCLQAADTSLAVPEELKRQLSACVTQYSSLPESREKQSKLELVLFMDGLFNKTPYAHFFISQGHASILHFMKEKLEENPSCSREQLLAAYIADNGQSHESSERYRHKIDYTTIIQRASDTRVGTASSYIVGDLEFKSDNTFQEVRYYREVVYRRSKDEGVHIVGSWQEACRAKNGSVYNEQERAAILRSLKAEEKPITLFSVDLATFAPVFNVLTQRYASALGEASSRFCFLETNRANGLRFIIDADKQVLAE